MNQLQHYSTLSHDQLTFIIKDASEAAEAMHSLGNEEAEGKYLDQVNDACTVLYRRSQDSKVTGYEGVIR